MKAKPNGLRLLRLYAKSVPGQKKTRDKAQGESELSPWALSLVFDGALCAPQAGFAGRPGTVDYRNCLTQASRFYGDKRRFLCAAFFS